MTYAGAGENENVALQPDKTKLPMLQPQPREELRRVMYKRPWPADVIPACSGSQPTCKSEATSTEARGAKSARTGGHPTDDETNAIGRQLVDFFRNDSNMRCIGVQIALEMLPEECKAYVGEV